MAAPTKTDYLSEVLKQMQAKKTVKPDDAAKALAQYHKIQEQVRSLKEEIQVFKDTQSKMVRTSVMYTIDALYMCLDRFVCDRCKSDHYVTTITNEPRHDKTNKVSVRPAKTQIRLGIRPV